MIFSEKIIEKYKNDRSITSINKHFTNCEISFLNQPVKKNQVSKLLKLSNDKKAVQSTDITSKLIKEFDDFFTEFI